MDYSPVDYTNNRISWLEQEVDQLKAELMRTRMSVGSADGGFDLSAPARETRTTGDARVIWQKRHRAAAQMAVQIADRHITLFRPFRVPTLVS
jgi:hypothetical protein